MMDNSETKIVKWYEDPIYHKMCEKAEEIQALKNDIEMADYFYSLRDKDIICLSVDVVASRASFEIWLPRQDQLQEMVKGDALYKRQRLIEFDHKLSNSSNPVNWHIRYSMEQLWLAFVMKENYNKVWNGEDWVDE